MPLEPKLGTLERVLLDAMRDNPEGVTYLDLIGTGITEENIDRVAKNLRTGVFEAEEDDLLDYDD